MYQGKFNSNNKPGAGNIHDIIAQRNAGTVSRPAASQGIPPRQQRPSQPQTGRSQVPQPAPAAEAPRRRGPRLGGVIFYTIYFLFIFLFSCGLYLGLNWLQGWLVDYEAAQPTTKCQQVFDALFTDPDWASLYDAAAIADTDYEGKEEFVAYMEARVGDQELSYMETSAGLSGDKKYVVKLGDERIATFTLQDANKDASSDMSLDLMAGDMAAALDAASSSIPDWQLGTVELFYQRNESYRIQKVEGHTAYVNGVPLEERHTIQIATTIAENYLPMGVTGVKTCIQEVSGLMVLPTVTITDDKGNPMEVVYEEETGTFVELTVANTIGEDERQVALKAMQTYGLFMIEKSSAAEVAKYFDSTTETYKTIVRSEIWWTQDNRGAEFSDEVVSGYTRYSDSIFSVRVSSKLNVTRTDGSIKTFPVDTTFFFRNTTGKWLVFLMTNVDVTQPVGQVRLTFMNGDEEVSTGFVYTDASTITTPLVSTPEGKRFAGWVRETVDENGVKTLTIEFGPTETGEVNLPSGSTLEPMVLHAYFENAEEGGEA